MAFTMDLMIMRPAFLSIPCLVVGTPVARAIERLRMSTPRARLGEKEVPGIPNIFMGCVFLYNTKVFTYGEANLRRNQIDEDLKKRSRRQAWGKPFYRLPQKESVFLDETRVHGTAGVAVQPLYGIPPVLEAEFVHFGILTGIWQDTIHDIAACETESLISILEHDELTPPDIVRGVVVGILT